MQITKGQRLKLADVLQPTQSFQLDIRLNERTLPCDFACFGLNANGKLLASRIEIKVPRKPGDGSKAVGLVEFKGALTAKRELQIEVNGFTVNIKPATKLKIGTTKNMTATDFINGLIIGETVKVEGIADANKVVTAIEIEAEREKD